VHLSGCAFILDYRKKEWQVLLPCLGVWEDYRSEFARGRPSFSPVATVHGLRNPGTLPFVLSPFPVGSTALPKPFQKKKALPKRRASTDNINDPSIGRSLLHCNVQLMSSKKDQMFDNVPGNYHQQERACPALEW